MNTQAHRAPRTRIQATRNEFPHSIEFNTPTPQNVGNIQPIQASGRRYFGNVEALLERERARLAGQDTPGTGPKPGTGNGGWSGGCK